MFDILGPHSHPCADWGEILQSQVDPGACGRARFDVNRCNESTLRVEKPDFWPVSKFSTISLPLRGIQPVNRHNNIAPTNTTKIKKKSQTGICRFTCLTSRTEYYDRLPSDVSQGYVAGKLPVAYRRWLLPAILRTLAVIGLLQISDFVCVNYQWFPAWFW